MAHGDAREWKWRGNWRMEWVASTLHTTSQHGVSSITTADAHTSAASSRLNWRPRRFKLTRPFSWKTKSGFCACAITFQLASIIKRKVKVRLHLWVPWRHVGREIGGRPVIALTSTSGLDGDKYQPHALTDISPKKVPLHPLNRRLVGPHSRSGRFGEEKNFSEPRLFTPAVSSPCDCSVATLKAVIKSQRWIVQNVGDSTSYVYPFQTQSA